MDKLQSSSFSSDYLDHNLSQSKAEHANEKKAHHKDSIFNKQGSSKSLADLSQVIVKNRDYIDSEIKNWSEEKSKEFSQSIQGARNYLDHEINNIRQDVKSVKIDVEKNISNLQENIALVALESIHNLTETTDQVKENINDKITGIEKEILSFKMNVENKTSQTVENIAIETLDRLHDLSKLIESSKEYINNEVYKLNTGLEYTHKEIEKNMKALPDDIKTRSTEVFQDLERAINGVKSHVDAELKKFNSTLKTIVEDIEKNMQDITVFVSKATMDGLNASYASIKKGLGDVNQSFSGIHQGVEFITGAFLGYLDNSFKPVSNKLKPVVEKSIETLQHISKERQELRKKRILGFKNKYSNFKQSFNKWYQEGVDRSKKDTNIHKNRSYL